LLVVSMHALALYLLLVALSFSSAPPSYVNLSILLVAFQLLAPSWLLPLVSSTPFNIGQQAAAWICLQPNLFPVPQPIPSFAPKVAYALWILRALWFYRDTTSLLSSHSTLCSMIEFGLLLLGLAWRCYLKVLQLRATPPIAMATPVLSAIIPLFHYEGDQFYNADGSSEEVAARRRQSMLKLSSRWGPKGKREQDAPSGGKDEADRLAVVRQYLADTRFTKSVNTFFPFQRYLKENLDPHFILDHVTDENYIVDVDGTKLWDADCSFGVNVLGYGHYKRFLQFGLEESKKRSVCLGKLTPQVSSNAKRICQLSNKEQCSFHMSGTEAIMGAVRLARFNTGRPLICVFGGAYHGWYDGVMQLGTARPQASADLLVLRYGSEASLQLLSARRHEIAAVLVNPLCVIDVNKPPPADFSLLSNVRGKNLPKVDEYGAWMRRLVETCRDAGVVSICDEVYVGFRYARVSV